MRSGNQGLGGVVLLLIGSFSLGAGEAMAIEESRYTVVEQADNFELRWYEPSIVAETFVDGDFSAVGSEGFRRLAGYIFGKNRKQESIDMTAPVSQEPSSEKIAMTAPVNQEAEGGKWRITFTMPAEYTMEALPVPLDDRVTLKQEPGRLMAAIRYSGTWSRDRYQEREASLSSLIGEHGLKAVGDPVFARYNAPFTLWFLRRNEVLIPVERSQNQQK
jgi:hypothetical protein